MVLNISYKYLYKIVLGSESGSKFNVWYGYSSMVLISEEIEKNPNYDYGSNALNRSNNRDFFYVCTIEKR